MRPYPLRVIRVVLEGIEPSFLHRYLLSPIPDFGRLVFVTLCSRSNVLQHTNPTLVEV